MTTLETVFRELFTASQAEEFATMNIDIHTSESQPDWLNQQRKNCVVICHPKIVNPFKFLTGHTMATEFLHPPQDCNDRPVDPYFLVGTVVPLKSKKIPHVIVKDWLGCGAFGQVFLVETDDHQEFALKVEHIDGMWSSLENEWTFYQHIERFFQQSVLRNVLKGYNFWTCKDKKLMLMEKAGISLLDLMRQRVNGLALDILQGLLRQLIPVLIEMKQSKIVHTDIKPENIVFDTTGRFAKLIDFGGAHFENTVELGEEFQTLWYRAPEVVLGLNPTFPIDVWSLGCVLLEARLQCPIFPSGDNLNHLQLIEKRIGPFPLEYTRTSRFFQDYFEEDGEVQKGEEGVEDNAPLVFQDMQILDLLLDRSKVQGEELEAFSDLLQQMLLINPEQRITPEEIKDHRFLWMDIPSGI